MPRKKQGHSRESATGGYLKKKTDPGLILIPNESLKHFPVNNELVFKFKKTVSSNIPLSASNEKNDREHIEATKSLNDNTKVSQHEVNNNLIELTPIQDGNKNPQSSMSEVNFEKNGNKFLQSVKVSDSYSTSRVMNVSVNNSLSAVFPKREQSSVTSSPEKKSSVAKKDAYQSTIQVNNKWKPTSRSLAASPKPGEVRSGHPKEETVEVQNQQLSEMSGTVAVSSCHSGIENKAETQASYRVSSSEKLSNGFKDAANPVLEQNCQLPSSVYGKSASSIENVLTGLHVPDKGKENDSQPFGKTSYLQEILEKKTQRGSYFSKSHSEVSICKETAVQSDSKSAAHLAENKVQPKAESKLKLKIPDVPVNEDSNSLASAESQKSSKFNKITSPQNLEQHISKIISENAAIVDTIDPIWNRRYYKQTSLTGSDTESKKTERKVSRMCEEKSNSSHNSYETSNKSKLQSALLGGCEELNTQKFSPVPSMKEKSVSKYSNSLDAPPPSNVFSKSPFSVSEDEMKGSAIKSLLSFKQSRNSKHKKSFDFDQDVYHQHPQNPERSIIKDLLLKSKSSEESKTKSEADEKLSSQFDSHSAFTEFSYKHNFEPHPHYNDSTSSLLSLRDSAEKFRFKDTSAQAKPLDDLNFQYKIRRQTWTAPNTHSVVDSDEGVGKILKKELLKTSSPNKRRKLTDSGATLLKDSYECFKDITDYKAFPSNLTSDLELSPHRGRSQSVHLYGGEVQVLDGSKTKKIKIKTTISRAFPMFDKFSSTAAKKLKSDDSEMERDPNLAGVIVTIAQPAHNNGGTVHMSSRKPVPSISPVSYSSDISAPCAKYPKMEVASPAASLTKISQLSDRVNSTLEKAQSLSYPYDFFPGPDSKPTLQKLSVPFEMKALAVDSVMDIPPSSLKVTLSPGNKPFYSPIFSGSEKSFDLSVGDKQKEKSSTVQRVVPTVLFTPSSPTHPSTDDTTAISEPAKKFLAPARPTSLPLKKKPFTMVSSTLVSPETPRPKKSCVQLYLNGHAYTYLGLKCSTRSTYCCIYRPQPMFVSQETNPKLSMYSNWQVMPAKEELSGLTPGQMISFYNSKQKRESKLLTTTSKLGEPLIFTHSSYWTYRSQDHSDEKSKSTPQSDASANQIEDSAPASEYIQVSVSENTRKESVISSVGIRPEKVILSASDSNSCLEPENTVSEAEELNNSNEEDDDCQDDRTESLTDSSQPQPLKRVKICEGGFKSNEDYTYVRGRGRGKYVCEECGIRCKKPSMLKKHIRTHTDLRPYKCRHCSFAFKTKGNLTKHMKSKAHHKKCTELGIIPVPTTTDDSQIDEEALAKQIEKKKNQFSDGEDADDDDDEDSDESEDECESDSSSMISSNQAKMLSNGHSKQTNSQEKPSTVSSEESVKAREPVSQHTLEQEVASSLLNLSSFGEPSQWSTSTGDLTDVTSSGETETGSVPLRSDQSLLSPSQFSSQSVTGVIASVARSKNMTEQWLSTETLGHRPRSYSADIPLSGGKESLSKYKLARDLNSENARTTPVEESSEFGIREQYSRRYSISVAREARRPRLLTPPDWVRTAHKWLQGGETDQPMDLSITRDLSKCKPLYDGGISDSLLGIVTQEESGSEASLASSLDPYGESYQLKSLPVLSPQVLAEYESGGDGTHAEPNLLSSSEEQASFGEASASRPMFYVQDVPVAEPASSRREGEPGEDPPSPDIADYAVNSPNSPPNLEDNPYYYPQENAAQSANPEEGSSSRIRAEFIVPNSSSSGSMEEGKCVCRICNKIFAKSSHLRLHVNIHYFERPFRCDNCAVSFRTKGHLQKHKRSVSHYNKVNMNMTFGTPTVDNPRPFKCGDCKIAFRIHGHLAKHLRSKMHIMKLECLGKLPFGMYAEMERSGVSLNEIDTTDCNNSLESLQAMAQKLYQRDPRRMRWQETEQISDTGCVIPAAPAAASIIESILPASEPLAASFNPSCSTISLPISTLPTSISLPVSSLPPSLTLPDSEEVKQELSDAEAFRMSSIYTDADSAISSLTQYIIPQPSTTATTIETPVNTSPETTQRVEGNSEKDSSASLHRSCTCHICGRLFKSAKFLQVHLYAEHLTWNSSIPNEASSSNTSVSSASSSPELPCDLCGKQFPNQKALQQHLLSHAQPRPFVCELCDAGFTSSSSLVAHKATHQNNSFASTGTENRTPQSK